MVFITIISFSPCGRYVISEESKQNLPDNGVTSNLVLLTSDAIVNQVAMTSEIITSTMDS